MSLRGGPGLEGNLLMGWCFGKRPFPFPPTNTRSPSSRITTEGPRRGFRASQPRCPALTFGPRARVAAVQRGAERRGAAGRGWARSPLPHPSQHPPQQPPYRCAELQGGKGVVWHRRWLGLLSLNGRFGLKCVLCLQLVASWAWFELESGRCRWQCRVFLQPSFLSCGFLITSIQGLLQALRKGVLVSPPPQLPFVVEAC